MKDESIADAWRRTESTIAAALKEFEAAAGVEVVGVDLVDVEVTSVNDERPRFSRMVRIEVRRRPGVDWGQA